MIAALLLATALAVQGAEPRALYEAGQFEAAAAAFERRWLDAGRGLDGLNAAIAWRSAGAYARARALLARVREAGLEPALDVRAELVARKLDELTGTLVLEGEPLPEDVVVRVDGAVAERCGEVVLAPVGIRELSVEREGCETFRWSGELRPGVRLPVAYTSRCPALPGSLHVRLVRGTGGTLAVAGRNHPIAVEDVSVALPPGRHAYRVESGSTLFERGEVDIRPGARAERRVVVPWRAQPGGVAVRAGVAALAGHDSTIGPLASFGFSGPLDLLVQAGAAPPITPGGGWSRVLRAQLGIYRWLPPLVAGRLGRIPVSVHLEPLAIQLGSREDQGGLDRARGMSLAFLPVMAFADLPLGTHLAVEVFTVRRTSSRAPGGSRFDTVDRWAGPAAQVSIGWRFLDL